MIAAKEEILNNPVYSELIISPSGDTTAMQVTLRKITLYRDLITQRYELAATFNDLSSNQKNELRNINQKISKINDEEARQRAELITQIRELLQSNQ